MSEQIEAYRRLKTQLRNYSSIIVLDFDETAATIVQSLKQAKIRVGTQDLKIAGISLAHAATLLSCNLRDFGKVPGLQVEDWTE
jgi:tRNA(fMet)-specific endonuclease VapC